jgi:DNA-binding beta-propeller fold protein YncE
MILKFSRTGQFLMQIGGRGQKGGHGDTKNVERAADIAVDPKTNELFVADGYGNRRVIVFDAETGAFKRMWGAFGKAPDTNPPAPPGPPPPSTQGTAQQQPEGAPQFATPVHTVRISQDGLVYIADRSNRRIQVFTTAGRYVNQVFINREQSASACGIAFSQDPEQKYMYVADYGNSKLVVLERKTLTELYQFGERGPAPGQFQGLHQLSADSKGNLYSVEVAPGNRAQRFTFTGIGQPLQ